jgi:hypothetical protein
VTVEKLMCSVASVVKGSSLKFQMSVENCDELSIIGSSHIKEHYVPISKVIIVLTSISTKKHSTVVLAFVIPSSASCCYYYYSLGCYSCGSLSSGDLRASLRSFGSG